MADAGFVYEPMAYFEEQNLLPPGPEYGFGYSIPLPTQPTVPDPVDPNAEHVQALPPQARTAYLLALQGDPNLATMSDDEGCQGIAFASTRPPRAARELIGQLQDEVQKRFFASAEWLAVQRDQSACWKAAGFAGDPGTLAFERFNALIGEHGDDIPAIVLGEMQDYERDAATAASNCDSKAGPRLAEVQFAIEQELIDEHPELFNLLGEDRGTELP
jgi:hypothetical protein